MLSPLRPVGPPGRRATSRAKAVSGRSDEEVSDEPAERHLIVDMSGGKIVADVKDGSLSQSDEVSTVAQSLGDSSPEPSDAETRLSTEVAPGNSMRYGTQIQACRAYAHHPHDVGLLDTFLGLAELPGIDEDSVKLLLKTLKLLRLCDYGVEDLCAILAHASAYFVDAYDLCGVNMDSIEVGHVLVTLMFIGHCYVQDETCPLHVWHQHLLRNYCSLRTLNSAIIRLLTIRKFILRLSSEDLDTRSAALHDACRENTEASMERTSQRGRHDSR